MGVYPMSSKAAVEIYLKALGYTGDEMLYVQNVDYILCAAA